MRVLKENWVKHHGFAHSQDREIPPALRTNQIAGFGGFRRLTSLKKNKLRYYVTMLIESFVKLQIGLLPSSCH